MDESTPIGQQDGDRDAVIDMMDHNIPADDISRFFAKKWKNLGCDICGESGTWVTLSDLDRYSVLASLAPDQRLAPVASRFQVALNVLCSNCGNLKLLAFGVIKTWLKENPAGE